MSELNVADAGSMKKFKGICDRLSRLKKTVVLMIVVNVVILAAVYVPGILNRGKTAEWEAVKTLVGNKYIPGVLLICGVLAAFLYCAQIVRMGRYEKSFLLLGAFAFFILLLARVSMVVVTEKNVINVIIVSLLCYVMITFFVRAYTGSMRVVVRGVSRTVAERWRKMVYVAVIGTMIGVAFLGGKFSNREIVLSLQQHVDYLIEEGKEDPDVTEELRQMKIRVKSENYEILTVGVILLLVLECMELKYISATEQAFRDGLGEDAEYDWRRGDPSENPFSENNS